jgi:YD repeat-containing protein
MSDTFRSFVSTSATTEANGQYTDKVTDALGNVTDTNWDANKGLLTSSIDAKNATTSYTYNSSNDKLTSVSSGGAIVNYGYTGDQLSSITRNNFSYNFTFDSLGNPTSVKMGTIPLITHSYQARTSRLSSSLYANGGKVEYLYDTLDRVIEGDITGLIDVSGDITGVEVADDFLLGLLCGGVEQGLIMIFG